VTIDLQSSAENLRTDILIPNLTDNGWQKLAELFKILQLPGVPVFVNFV